jgi:hypothetical protein
VITVDIATNGRLSDNQYNSPIEKWRRERYVKNLASHYDTPSNFDDYNPEPPKCEHVEFKSYAQNRTLFLVDKHIYAECKSILLDFQQTLTSGISNNVFQEHPRPEFWRLLAENKVYFNCHPYELYIFLESSTTDVLKNIKSIVLGERLLSGDWSRGCYYNTNVTVGPAEPWSSTSEPFDLRIYISDEDNRDKHYNYYEYEMPRIMELIDTRLPNLREVAVWAPTNGVDGSSYYSKVANNLCKMIAGSRIDRV